MKKKKTKISWKTILAIITAFASILSLILVAFAPLCLTWTGAVFLLVMVTIAGYSLDYYLNDMKKLNKKNKKFA